MMKMLARTEQWLSDSFAMNSMDNSRPNYPQLLARVLAMACIVLRPPLVRLSITALFLVLCGCAITDSDRFGTETDATETAGQKTVSDDKARLSKPLTTATYPGSQVPVDEKSGLVAANLVIALQQVFTQRALPLRVSFRRPGNSLEFHLVEQLQRAGFAVFVAKQETGSESPSAIDEQLYYGIERVSRGGVSEISRNGENNNPEFNDYSFQLQFKDFAIKRQYRVSAQSLQPLSPMVLMFMGADRLQENRLQENRLQDNRLPHAGQPQQLEGKNQADPQPTEQILLQTDDSLFYN